MAQTYFVYIDEYYAINSIHPKFVNLLLTGNIPRGVTKRGCLKNIRKRSISRYLKVVHNIKLS